MPVVRGIAELSQCQVSLKTMAKARKSPWRALATGADGPYLGHRNFVTHFITDERMMKKPHCAHCKKAFTQTPRYCSASHRQRAFELRRAQAEISISRRRWGATSTTCEPKLASSAP